MGRSQEQTCINEQSGELKKKITVEQVRNIWNDESVTYSDEELTAIRDWVYGLSEIVFDIFENTKNKTQVIELKATEHEIEEGDIIRAGEYRRAGRKRA